MFCFNLIIQTSLKKQRLHQRGRREIVRMALITNHTHPSKEMLNKKTYFLNSTALDNVVEFNRLAIRFQALFSSNLLLFRQMHTGVFIAHLICASWTPAICKQPHYKCSPDSFLELSKIYKCVKWKRAYEEVWRVTRGMPGILAYEIIIDCYCFFHLQPAN